MTAVLIFIAMIEIIITPPPPVPLYLCVNTSRGDVISHVPCQPLPSRQAGKK